MGKHQTLFRMKNNDYIIKKSLNNNIDDNFTNEEIHKKKRQKKTR